LKYSPHCGAFIRKFSSEQFLSFFGKLLGDWVSDYIQVFSGSGQFEILSRLLLSIQMRSELLKSQAFCQEKSLIF
jgi:hypothetical protein